MFDALTIAAIVDELGIVLEDARIQRIQHIDALTLGIEIYSQRTRRWLVLSADPQHARILLEDQRGGGDPSMVTPLFLLLRKYARGGRVISVTQPRHERLVRISIAKTFQADGVEDDDGEFDEGELGYDLVHHELVIELMGRHSNILLVDEEGRIRDAIKRVTPDMSRVRPILPGHEYSPPPPQNKQDPAHATAESVYVSAVESDQNVQRWLVAVYLAMSPALAREIATRAEVDAKQDAASLSREDADRVVQAMLEVFEPLESRVWQPHLYRFADGGAEFSAIRMLSLERDDQTTSEPCESVVEVASRAWELGPAPAAGSGDRHAARRKRMLDEIELARDRVGNRIRSLREQQEHGADAGELRSKGEMIYAYLWMIEPGQDALETPDGVAIALDPTLSPADNAQVYFERYRKAKSATENVPEMIEQTQRQLDYVDQLHTMASQADSYDEIESVRLEWAEYADETPGMRPARRETGSKPSAAARRPRCYLSRYGGTLYIGRTGKQNDEVTFGTGNPDDLWLHARELPGAHVILRLTPDADADDAIEDAAALAAYYSDGRGSTRVPVDVTERRYVRKIKGAGPGMVTYRNERTINVTPKSEEDLGLEAVR